MVVMDRMGFDRPSPTEQAIGRLTSAIEDLRREIAELRADIKPLIAPTFPKAHTMMLPKVDTLSVADWATIRNENTSSTSETAPPSTGLSAEERIMSSGDVANSNQDSSDSHSQIANDLTTLDVELMDTGAVRASDLGADFTSGTDSEK
jgi:hypothetical protein